MDAMTITVLGGTGFVGRHLVARLTRDGHRLRVLTRRRERNRALLVLPAVSLVEGDVHDQDFLAQQFTGADAVINLIGILNEKGDNGRGFDRIHVELPRKVAEACKHTGVKRALHMSALNAGPNAPSHYLRSKGTGEEVMHVLCKPHGCAVTSFRPSVIYGADDSFTQRFASLLRRIPFFFPLACPDAKFAPIHVEDVAHCFAQALNDARTRGQGYDLCGPKAYTLAELVTYIAHEIGVERRIIALSDWQSRMQAAFMEWAPGKPFSRDNYRSLQADSVCTGAFPTVFGVTPAALEDIAPAYLRNDVDPLDTFRATVRRD
jgi:NADH dehydrogenase